MLDRMLELSDLVEDAAISVILFRFELNFNLVEKLSLLLSQVSGISRCLIVDLLIEQDIAVSILSSEFVEYLVAHFLIFLLIVHVI